MRTIGEKIKNGTDGWMGGALSFGGRVTKIDACLSNSAVYQMSLRLLHKTIIVEISGGRRKKLEGGHTSKKKICVPQIVINVWQINNI
jgi:hypothetical protein